MVKKYFQNYFSTKSYLSVSQNIKMRNGLKSENTKVPKFCTNIRLFKCECMSKKTLKILFRSKVTCMILLQNLERCV